MRLQIETPIDRSVAAPVGSGLPLRGEFTRAAADYLEKGRERGLGCRRLTPAKHESTLRRGAGQRTKRHLRRQMLCFRWRHERGPKSRAHETNAVRARPDFFGDLWRHTRRRERTEDPIVKA